MSQATASIANMSRTLFRAAVNAALQALQSTNSGATAPSETYPYMLWADTTSGWVKQRNAADSAWIKRWPIGTGAAADIASATTLDLTSNSASSGTIRVTGTTTTTAITLEDGQTRLLRAAAAWPITHSASLVCPGGVSYTCAAGDIILAIGEASSVVRLAIWRADGTPVVSSGSTQIQPISASVGSNALTISASALSLDFRSATLGSGAVTRVSGTPANLVISSGSTLGTSNGVQSRIAVLALNNAGTLELAAVNVAGGVDLTETGLISTTAEGGAGAADSASVVYSTTARTSLAYRVIGYIESTQATAGTWATAPSTIQGVGGQAWAAMASLGYGQTWQDVKTSPGRSTGTTYYNTTGKPIVVSLVCSAVSSTSVTVNGNVLGYLNANALQHFIVPPGGSYVISAAGTTVTNWWELR